MAAAAPRTFGRNLPATPARSTRACSSRPGAVAAAARSGQTLALEAAAVTRAARVDPAVTAMFRREKAAARVVTPRAAQAVPVSVAVAVETE